MNYATFFEPQFIASAGYRFFLSDDVSALPSMMMQFIKPYPVQVHANIKLQYQDKFWVGASYRKSDQLGGFAAMAGMNVSNTFNCTSGKPISIRSLVENHLKFRNKTIKLNLGHYPYPDYEPFAFWGE